MAFIYKPSAREADRDFAGLFRARTEAPSEKRMPHDKDSVLARWALTDV